MGAKESTRQDRLVVSAPLPPSSNHTYYTGKDGRRHLTKTAREYKASIAVVMMTSRAQKKCPEPPFALYLHLRFPNRRRTDNTNRIKLLEDAVFEHLPYDDSLVYDTHVFKYLDPNSPGVTLELRHTDRALEAS